MTPKQKAEELVKNFSSYVDYQEDDCFSEKEKMMINAKHCALIAVDEIVKKQVSGIEFFYYWDQVRYEIQKL
jgi:hypothetical protein